MTGPHCMYQLWSEMNLSSVSFCSANSKSPFNAKYPVALLQWRQGNCCNSSSLPLCLEIAKAKQ